MNWKRPQDELPPETLDVLLRIEQNQKNGDIEIKHAIGDYSQKEMGFFVESRWGEFFIKNVDGTFESDRWQEFFLTHWCEIEEPV